MPKCEHCRRNIEFIDTMPGRIRLPMERCGRYLIRDPHGPDTAFSARTLYEVRGQLLPLDNEQAHWRKAKEAGKELLRVWELHLTNCPGPTGKVESPPDRKAPPVAKPIERPAPVEAPLF